jgi:hypothetical protein
MTPTRTDTTPRQARQAFKHISLNNARSQLRSPRAACSHLAPRPCSAATAGLNNNEHGSNNKYGDHTKELIHWIMSKDAVASCFIKDVFSMSESENGGGTHWLAFLFPTHPNSACDRTSLLFSWSCTLQVGFPSCHHSRSYSVRTSCSLHP